ncbi:MAG: hypothetical protein WCK74_05015 [Gemmatimonadaceae bacterium]
MRLTHKPRLLRLLALLTLLQIVAPSVAAIADAWRLDQRTASAHIESETSSSCVVVHAHDCLLCSVATAPNGTVPPAGTIPMARRGLHRLPATASLARSARQCAPGSPRAPPARTV